MKDRAVAHGQNKHLAGQHRRRKLAFLAVVGVGLLVLLSACSEETQDQIRDAIDAPAEPEVPQEPEPEPEVPQEPEPEPEVPQEDDGLSDEDWLILGLMGLAALAIIIGATSLATRHSEAKKSAQATLELRIRQISEAGRWVHDEGSVDVLRLSDPDQIRSSWGTTRVQMIELERRIAALGADEAQIDPVLLTELGQTVASLRGSLDSSVAVRLDSDGAANAALVESTTQTVLERRRDLETALRPLGSIRV